MFVPPDTANVVMAQGIGPSGAGAWLVLTAPTPEKLQSGAATLARNANWELLSGSLTLFGIGENPMESRPVTRVTFLPTQPFSFWNFRLIAANWLSTNILSYALLLASLSVLLGLVTFSLLGRFGKGR